MVRLLRTITTVEELRTETSEIKRCTTLLPRIGCLLWWEYIKPMIGDNTFPYFVSLLTTPGVGDGYQRFSPRPSTRFALGRHCACDTAYHGGTSINAKGSRTQQCTGPPPYLVAIMFPYRFPSGSWAQTPFLGVLEHFYKTTLETPSDMRWEISRNFLWIFEMCENLHSQSPAGKTQSFPPKATVVSRSNKAIKHVLISVHLL